MIALRELAEQAGVAGTDDSLVRFAQLVLEQQDQIAELNLIHDQAAWLAVLGNLNSVGEVELPNGWQLVRTCFACPEQYDLLENGVERAYFRLRWGGFTVECPACGEGEIVYSGSPDGDGVFEDYERAEYLLRALEQVLRYWQKKVDNQL